jgi:hypothetical protein
MSPGARAGAGSVGGRMKPEGFVHTARWFRDRSIGHALQIGQCGASPNPPSRPESPACRLRAFVASTVWKLRSPEGDPQLSSLHPAASRRRVEGGSKIPSSFRVLRRQSEEPIPALDDWRMGLAPESGKESKVKLSTCKAFAGGQAWITSISLTKPVTYPRSRLANRRNRSALSLMNPPASRWS